MMDCEASVSFWSRIDAFSGNWEAPKRPFLRTGIPWPWFCGAIVMTPADLCFFCGVCISLLADLRRFVSGAPRAEDVRHFPTN